MMRRRSLAWVSIVLLGFLSACRREPATPPFTPGLGEIMTMTQMRHAKLWFAGTAGNWPLASYELDELDEGMQDAATFHRGLQCLSPGHEFRVQRRHAAGRESVLEPDIPACHIARAEVMP